MKIAVLSLLRLGDILIVMPAIQQLRIKYPNARIDLIVNKQNENKIKFFHGIDRIIPFDREYLQRSIGSLDHGLFEAFDITNKFVQMMNAEKYDLLVNLTQNKLSGYLSSLVEAKEKIGLVLNAKEQVSFGSRWIKYLNDVVALGAETVFHYSDIFHFSVSGEVGQQKYSFIESDSGKKELEEYYQKHSYSTEKKIVIQPVTSDAKKNWPVAKWVETILQLSVIMPSVQIILLGAPNENDILQNIIRGLGQNKNNVQSAILSFEGALSLLNHCDLLVTGDTSIKHLAAGTGIQILELVMGSSDMRKTGVYKDGSVLIAARADCSPCAHSAPCFKQSHICADKIPVEVVTLTIKSMLEKNMNQLRLVAKEFADTVQVFQANLSKFGFWFRESLDSSDQWQTFHELVEKISWFMFLENEHKRQIGHFGSAIARHKHDFLDLFTNIDLQKQISGIDRLEIETIKTEEKLNFLSSQIAKNIGNIGGAWDFTESQIELNKEIESLQKKLKLGQFFSEKIKIHNINSFSGFRQLQNSIQDTSDLQHIKVKILRQIKLQFLGSEG